MYGQVGQTWRIHKGSDFVIWLQNPKRPPESKSLKVKQKYDQ